VLRERQQCAFPSTLERVGKYLPFNACSFCRASSAI
jgi:hypothetical protein